MENELVSINNYNHANGAFMLSYYSELGRDCQ